MPIRYRPDACCLPTERLPASRENASRTKLEDHPFVSVECLAEMSVDVWQVLVSTEYDRPALAHEARSTATHAIAASGDRSRLEWSMEPGVAVKMIAPSMHLEMTRAACGNPVDDTVATVSPCASSMRAATADAGRLLEETFGELACVGHRPVEDRLQRCKTHAKSLAADKQNQRRKPCRRPDRRALRRRGRWWSGQCAGASHQGTQRDRPAIRVSGSSPDSSTIELAVATAFLTTGRAVCGSTDRRYRPHFVVQ